MKNPLGRAARGLGVLLASALALAACTIAQPTASDSSAGGGSIQPIEALKGAPIKVGSKEFDEQLLLGQIAIIALQAAGAAPQDQTNITGSDAVRNALTSGSIDLYYEYTGTAWASFLKKTEKVDDPKQLFEAVKAADQANNVTWWALSPANDTYAIAANGEAATKYGVKSISDVANLAKSDPAAATMCIGAEFAGRDDGLPGLLKAYGITVPSGNVKRVADAVVYTSVGAGKDCIFGSVASTDGRIPAQKLVVLEDDKKFFPVYNPAISIRADIATKYPDIEKVFTPLNEKLTSEVLLELNKQISVDGRKPDAVAREWLKAQGFIA